MNGTANKTPHNTSNELQYIIEGMDCASCARKIENLVARTPGATLSKVSFTAQTLSLTLDETQTSQTRLEANIRALGFTPTLTGRTGLRTPANETDHETNHREHHGLANHVRAPNDNPPWHTSRAARMVFLTGGLLVIAWLFGRLEPQISTWGYMAATAIGVFPIARRAWAGARFGNPWTIETLVTTAAVVAIGINEAPEAAVVVFFFMIGELLEGIAAGHARAGIKSLAALRPKTAFVIDEGKHDAAKNHTIDTTEFTREIPAEQLKVGQVVRVPPGGRVPCDGVIVRGSSSLNDAPVTGESVPVDKTVGNDVFAGSINGDAVIDVRVEKTAQDNTIARIIKLVEEAENGKGNTARLIDRFSRYWTPGVVLVSALVAVLPPLMGGVWHDWLYRGISLLLIGCPCALVLSVPAAITSGLASGARRGLLVKGGAALETIGAVQTIAFDKTGTLTSGQARVTDVIPLGMSATEALRLAAGVENGSTHPLARAILTRAASQGISPPDNTDAQAVRGRAVQATVEERALAVGSPRYARELRPLEPELESQIAMLEDAGKTVVVLVNPPTPLALIAIRDEPRPDARKALAWLKQIGIRGVMLTGDNARTGKAIADDLGLDVHAELLPEDKLRIIHELKSTGKVAMIGDGINDAPALAAADVGIAMGGGADVALETADAALLRNAVTGVTELVQLSRATTSNIRQNIAFALGLKVVFLVMAILGMTNLWMAILADTGATALVTANALRLLAFQPKS